MIWVVTDHHDTRRALVPLIAAKGYEVVEIECGDEVRKRLAFQTASLIIVDCGMPDSFDVLSTVRNEPRATPVPVVMFSNDDTDLKEKALLKGANAYVGKGTMDWAEMIETVVQLAGFPGDANTQ